MITTLEAKRRHCAMKEGYLYTESEIRLFAKAICYTRILKVLGPNMNVSFDFGLPVWIGFRAARIHGTVEASFLRTRG